nr:MAG TPA: hypothetical protein [Caudoviricetes sp.]
MVYNFITSIESIFSIITVIFNQFFHLQNSTK